MATGLPTLLATRRTRATWRRIEAWSLWEQLMRQTSTPVSRSRVRTGSSQEAGPRVATILV